jgi:hypothetical protein
MLAVAAHFHFEALALTVSAIAKPLLEPPEQEEGSLASDG